MSVSDCQSLAVELDKLENELGCQELGVWRALGSVAPQATPCLDHLQSRLSVIQSRLSSRQAQLRARLDLTDQCQVRRAPETTTEMCFIFTLLKFTV